MGAALQCGGLSEKTMLLLQRCAAHYTYIVHNEKCRDLW